MCACVPMCAYLCVCVKIYVLVVIYVCVCVCASKVPIGCNSAFVESLIITSTRQTASSKPVDDSILSAIVVCVWVCVQVLIMLWSKCYGSFLWTQYTRPPDQTQARTHTHTKNELHLIFLCLLLCLCVCITSVVSTWLHSIFIHIRKLVASLK